jgi:hypothetical protein
VTDSAVCCGSRLPGSDGSRKVADLPLTTCADADAELVVLELAAEPELEVELEPPLEQAATETAAADRAAAVVRTLLRTVSPS